MSGSLWDLYRALVVDLDPILADMSAHGVRIDREAQARLGEKVGREIEEITAVIQPLVPREIKPKSLYKTKKYWREDWEWRPRAGMVKSCSICGATGITKATHFRGGKKNECVRREGKVVMIPGQLDSWIVTHDFNPLSVAQLADYAGWFGHRLGTNIKTHKTTLDDRTMRRLIERYGRDHPLYAHALRLRALARVKSTYVEGFAPDERGRITGYFNHNPETLRLAQSNNNLMNVSHRGSALYAREIRETIIPSEGCVFVEADSTAIEAVIVGYLAGDREYQERAALGIHADVCLKILNLPFTPENVAWVKREHPDLYERVKRTVHMTNYGGTPKMLAYQYPHVFPNEAEAKAAQDAYINAWPRIAEWWEETRAFAHKYGYLANPWGFRNEFFNVYRRSREGKVYLGEDGKEVIAFGPQSSAGIFMRENLKLIGATWARPFMPAIGSVHDSVCLDVPEDRVEEAVELLIDTLTRPIPQLGGLRVGCEVKIGKHNWAEMTTLKVVKGDNK